MPDYLASYWNGTTEVPVSGKDTTRYIEQPWLQRFCSTTDTCGTAKFASTLTPGPLVVPGAHVTPGGQH